MSAQAQDRRAVSLEVTPSNGSAWQGRLFIGGTLVVAILDGTTSRAHLIADLLEVLAARGVEIAPECVECAR